MENHKSFYKLIEETAKNFKNLDKRTIRIISHLDADGISACAILIRTLQREKINFVSSIIKQLDIEVLKEISREDYDCYFFLDLGSDSLSKIKKYLPKKTVFVLDHHKLEKNIPSNINLIHPHIFDIEGSREISGAGITYLFSRSINKKNKDLAYLALIGAIGDIQEHKGFGSLNNEILNDAKENNIKVINGLRIFGAQTKPLHKVLEYSTDPFIPGVTGSEQNALNFLEEIGINQKNHNNEYKKLIHLSKEDLKKLVTAIVIKRIGLFKNPDDVLGPVYIKKDEEEGPTKDLKEFSTLLNACGRLNKESLGIGTCLGDKRLKELAVSTLTQYKKELMEALSWFYENRNNKEAIIEKPGFVIINAEDQIRDTLIGTLASIISKSNLYKNNTLILSLAHTLDENTKISFRIVGQNKDIDLKQILSEITEKLGYKAGGHRLACGSLIPQEKETIFIKNAIETLKIKTIEAV